MNKEQQELSEGVMETELPPILITDEDRVAAKKLIIDPTVQPDNLTDLGAWWIKLVSWMGEAICCRTRQLRASLERERELQAIVSAKDALIASLNAEISKQNKAEDELLATGEKLAEERK